MDRLGLGYEALRRLNPRMIAASVKGFGGGGPYADYKSFEWIAQAMARRDEHDGLARRPAHQGHRRASPTPARASTRAIGILAAIIQRQATGRGPAGRGGPAGRRW